MNKFFVFPYKNGSKSAIALAQALGGRVLRRERSKFVGSPNKIIINWGSSETTEEVNKSTVINPPIWVRNASNKLTAFDAMRETVAVPRFSRHIEVASEWIKEGSVVVCRTVLGGHSGKGIVIVEKFDELVKAPLYVEYLKKKEEYRLHVMRDGDKIGIIDAQRKAKRNNAEKVNYRVRNLVNGFIYQRGFDKLPKDAEEQACRALIALQLDFGAVDIIWNEQLNKSYVLEINTAPGLEGQTINSYAQAFRRIYGG